MSKKLDDYQKSLTEAYLYELPVTRKDAAKILRVSVDTITDWTRCGMPISYYAGKRQEFGKGSRPRYIIRKCLQWLENRHAV